MSDDRSGIDAGWRHRAKIKAVPTPLNATPRFRGTLSPGLRDEV